MKPDDLVDETDDLVDGTDEVAGDLTFDDGVTKIAKGLVTGAGPGC